MIELTIPTLLQAAPDVIALTGSRIYPLVLPTEATLPAIEYSIVGSSSDPTFTSNGSQKFRVEINCWGATYADAVTLRHSVIKSLSGYYSGTTSVQYAMSHDLFDHELEQYRAIAEFYVMTTNY